MNGVSGTGGQTQASLDASDWSAHGQQEVLLSRPVELKENPWGYGKRLRFMRKSIQNSFPQCEPGRVRVLDVGCGNGALLAIPLASHGFDVTGVDVHPASIENARSRAKNLPNARFCLGKVEEIQDETFDVVILSEVLEHVPDPKALLEASLEHLKADGICLITVPNGYGVFEIDSWLYRTFRLHAAFNLFKRILRTFFPSHFTLHRTPTPATQNLECGHLQFFRRKRLKKIFADCSLTVIREAAGCFLCGPVICETLARSQRFVEWNIRIVDLLPLTFASSWYFLLRRSRP